MRKSQHVFVIMAVAYAAIAILNWGGMGSG